MVSSNKFTGLARGPIDHESSSVINAISNDSIVMGSVIKFAGIPLAEILPRVGQEAGVQGSSLVYGIAVGGDNDGIYGTTGLVTGDEFKATTAAGQAVVVVTQGRCPARVAGTQAGVNTSIVIGDKLTMSTIGGLLEKATTASSDFVIATALNTVDSGDTDIIPVDVQREGAFLA